MNDIAGKIRNGTPLSDVLVIDEHCHLEYNMWGYQPKGSAEDIIAVMDKLGVDISCISHCAALGADYKWGNDRVALALEKYPERFIGYCTVNPLYADDLTAELDRCFAKNERFMGIKLHPWCHQRPLAHSGYRDAYEYAAEHNAFVMSHTYDPGDVATTAELAMEYPDVIFIMAHMGGEFPTINKAVDVLNKHPNVYGDISGSLSMEGIVEWYVKEAGQKQIVYGTDMCCMDGRATFAMIGLAEIDEEAKKDIYGLNMKRILDKTMNSRDGQSRRFGCSERARNAI